MKNKNPFQNQKKIRTTKMKEETRGMKGLPTLLMLYQG
jgi:hypothetical protein